MSKAENVIRYYVLCNNLKEVIRTGWLNWHVKSPRIESVAEHIYGVEMLAIAMKSEYQYDIDLEKVIFMIAVHELEEIFIGDLTQFEITKAEKVIIGHEAVKNILKDLIDKDIVEALIIEFDERKTKEALFAYYCDKLECDIQSKLYDEANCVDLTKQSDNETSKDPRIISLINKGMSFGEMWMTFGKQTYNYDDFFLEVSNYALNNQISKYNIEIESYRKKIGKKSYVRSKKK